MAWIDNT
ncbi:hypothetical protein SPV_2526 [Streptococcus pneumoniae]|nr:hypothetical protein SPV_2526 [Streptococcus pneumoniae]